MASFQLTAPTHTKKETETQVNNIERNSSSHHVDYGNKDGKYLSEMWEILASIHRSSPKTTDMDVELAHRLAFRAK
jgi:hypothetical protein